jgi:hypothetical protein
VSAVGGQGASSSQGFVRMDKAPLVDSEVAKHVQRVEDPSLITVTHTPNAVTTHLVASESEERPVVRMEQGRVVTKVVTADYGTLISVVGGPAVIEVALHSDPAQRDAYRLAVAAVDAETRQHTLDAVQGFAMPIVLAVMQQLGVVEPEDMPAGAAAETEDGPAIWARLLYEHGRCSCAAFDDDTECTSTCALCASLPEGWPCPAWSSADYGPNATVRDGEPS